MNREHQQICDDVLQLLDKFKQTTLQLAEAHGLTRMQLFVLYQLEQRGEIAMGRIADAMHCDASNVTGIVDRLVASELVSRQELATDRRTKTLQLTPKGRKAVNALKAELPVLLGCDKLTPTEATCLTTIIQKLTA